MPVVPASRKEPPYWQWMRPYCQAVLPAQQMIPEKLEAILSFIEKEDFRFWTGYPSMIAELCKLAQLSGYQFTNPPAFVFTGSEATLPFQRALIESTTGSRLVDTYGSNEGCGNASQCEAGCYHEDFEFGILECYEPRKRDDGMIEGRILCTGFASPDAPLIRYDTGDIGVWYPESLACACGRSSVRLVGIDGRSDDAIHLPDGRRVTRFHYIFRESMNVLECQVGSA